MIGAHAQTKQYGEKTAVGGFGFTGRPAPARRLVATPLPVLGPVPSAESVVRELRHAERCGCVARSVMAYRDEDGDLTCARCGHHLSRVAGPVESQTGKLAQLMSAV